MAVKVAITGALSKTREEIVQSIESATNAQFSRGVTYDTDYLVASRFDTNKAKRAAKLGITVISESEMWKFISKGAFPETEKQIRHCAYPPNFRTDEIESEEEFIPNRLCFLEY